MISHRHKCFFIHIPKTAGTSIAQYFAGADAGHSSAQDHRSIRNLENALFPATIENFFSLDLARYFYQRYAARLEGLPRHSREQFNSYFKFAFVRNPWARVYSWYKNVMRDNNHKNEHNISDEISLEEFLTSHGNSWALRPQLSWITDRNGTIAIDFIGRFENLSVDFETVCRRLNIDDPQLPETLISNNPSWVDEYDNNSRKLVHERYAAEIEYFDYSFDQ
jgi:hypothetical protein